jgi:tetratricopeptide (TPR) repeat protein
MFMRLTAILTGLAGCTLLLLAPRDASAQEDKNWETCISTSGSAATRLPACTAVIDTKSVSGRKLAGAYCIRGNDLTEKGELDAALTDLNEAIGIDATYACAYVNRGRVYGLKRNYDRAIEDYDAAIKLDAKMALAYNNRGDAWIHKSEFDRAIADLSEAIRLNPGFVRAFGNRGIAHYRKHDYAHAIEDFSSEIRISWSTDAYINRGNAYRDSEQLDRAAADYTTVIKLAQRDARGWRNRGLIRLLKGDNKGGVADYDKALFYDPADADSWHNRGQAKARLGDRNGAVADFKKALEIQPDLKTTREALQKLEAMP